MTLTQFNRIVEIRTKVISMGTFLCGSTFAAVMTGSFSWIRFVLMGCAVLLVDMGTTGFNSYFDYLNGTDNRHLNLERDKVLVHEGVSPHLALVISLGLFGAAALLGLVLAWMTSWTILVAGAASMGVGFFYTGGPRPISRTPFGELFAGGFLGTLLFSLSYYIQASTFSIRIFAASLPFWILIGMILTVNNTCDLDADRQAGRRTLSILAGLKGSILILKAELASAYIISFALVILEIYPFWVLPFLILSLMLAFREWTVLETRGLTLATKGASMGSISLIFTSFSLSLLLGLLLTLLF